MTRQTPSPIWLGKRIFAGADCADLISRGWSAYHEYRCPIWRNLERVEDPLAGSISAVDADHDAGVIVAGSHEGRLRVARFSNVESDLRSHAIESGPLQAVRIDGDSFFIGNEHGMVAELDVETGAQIRSYEGHEGKIRSVSLYGEFLGATDEDGLV